MANQRIVLRKGESEPIVFNLTKDADFHVFYPTTGIGRDRTILEQGGAVVAFIKSDDIPNTYMAGAVICRSDEDFDKEYGKLRAFGRCGKIGKHGQKRIGSYVVEQPEGVSLKQVARAVLIRYMRDKAVPKAAHDFMQGLCLFPEDMPEDLRCRLSLEAHEVSVRESVKQYG